MTLFIVHTLIWMIPVNGGDDADYYSDYDDEAMAAGMQYAKDVYAHRTETFGLELSNAFPDPQAPLNPHRRASSRWSIWNKWFERGLNQQRRTYNVLGNTPYLGAKERGRRVGNMHAFGSSSRKYKWILPEAINPYNRITENKEFSAWMIGYKEGKKTYEIDFYPIEVLRGY